MKFEKKPRHQVIITRVLQILIGFLALGTFLDSISNAISIVTPLVTYIGSLIIILSWVFTRVFLKDHPIMWVAPEGRKIRVTRLGVQVKLALLGMFILLWVPRMVHIGDKDIKVKEANKQVTTPGNKTDSKLEGMLTPASIPSPPNPCEYLRRDIEDIDTRIVTPSQDFVTVFLGSSVLFTRRSATVLSMEGQEMLSLSKTEEGLAISAKIFSTDRRIISQIIANKFYINPNNYFRLERPDQHRLIVYDQEANEVLNVSYLNPQVIKILGVFNDAIGNRIVIKENKLLLNDVTYIGGCLGNPKTGLNVSKHEVDIVPRVR